VNTVKQAKIAGQSYANRRQLQWGYTLGVVQKASLSLNEINEFAETPVNQNGSI